MRVLDANGSESNARVVGRSRLRLNDRWQYRFVWETIDGGWLRSGRSIGEKYVDVAGTGPVVSKCEEVRDGQGHQQGRLAVDDAFESWICSVRLPLQV